jgi:hypothetical protein
MSKQLDLANAQMIGFKIGKWDGIIHLIESMGLTKKEWEKLKKDYEPQLDESDMKEIEDFFAGGEK